MTSGQINYLRDFAAERCKAIDGCAIERLLDEREALLRVVPRLLAFVTGDGLREMVEHEIVFGAPPLVSTTETQAWFDATEARVADDARKAIALAEAP